MSAFLGHIHFWLYNKIQRNILREIELVKAIDESFDGLGTELYEAPLSMYGDPIPNDKDLADIIDHNNIHGWLQEQIARGEIREATFIKDVNDTLGDDGNKLIFKTFYEHGLAAGKEAKESLPDISAPSIYKTMQNYYLNGMPCDGGDVILTTEDNLILWEGTHKNQLMNWKKSGAPTSLLTTCYQHWFKGFVDGIGETFTFQVEEGNPPQYSIQKA